MHPQANIALASPVYDPDRDIRGKHFWFVRRNLSAGLTVNIGME